MTVSRREILQGALTSPAAALLNGAPALDQIGADLSRYIGFGIKASGGPGDIATGHWVEQVLREAGFATRHVSHAASWFEGTASIELEQSRVELLPQAVVQTTPAGGIDGQLILGSAQPGSISLVDLPHGRWSSLEAKAIRQPLEAAFAAGAAAAIIIPKGPSGDALALNCDVERDALPGPVAIVAPRLAASLRTAALAGKRGKLRIEGAGGTRTATSIVGTIDRGARDWLILSTPRSGWFGCAGERGPGVAAWLSLVRGADAFPHHNLLAISTSGHEYENLGLSTVIKAGLPPPDRVALWFHIGANLAARDWHELGDFTLSPLPSADPQRFLIVPDSLVSQARDTFRGLAELEAAYPTSSGAAGELATILAAGYPRAAGVLGAHRYHHSRNDNSRCVDPGLIAPVADTIRRFLSTL